MADTLTATNVDKRILPPENQYTAVCVDGIDLGEQFDEKFQSWKPEYALVFQLNEINPDTNKPFELSQRFNVFMSAKAKLRLFLGQWRGKPYSEEEAAAGAPLHKLEGVNALVQVAHGASKATGKKYANIISIMPLPKGTPKIVAENYTRAEYWNEVKAKARKPEPAENDTFPKALEEADDDLPF